MHELLAVTVGSLNHRRISSFNSSFQRLSASCLQGNGSEHRVQCSKGRGRVVWHSKVGFYVFRLPPMNVNTVSYTVQGTQEYMRPPELTCCGMNNKTSIHPASPMEIYTSVTSFAKVKNNCGQSQLIWFCTPLMYFSIN